MEGAIIGDNEQIQVLHFPDRRRVQPQEQRIWLLIRNLKIAAL
jgi:hypothetical protein